MSNNDSKNLQNIQRIDSDASEIILQCTQAAFYEFDLTDQTWTTKEQVGPLFVYKRYTFPHYAIMIANRHSLQDFVQPIEETSSLRYDPPYILIHRSDGTIGGIWIYGEDECKRIFNGIQQLRNLVKSGGSLNSENLKAEPPKFLEKVTENSTVKKLSEVTSKTTPTEKVMENLNVKKLPDVKIEAKKSTVQTIERPFKPLKTINPAKPMKANPKVLNPKLANVESHNNKPQQMPSPTPKIMSRVQSFINIAKDTTKTSETPKTSDVAAAAASIFPEIIQENERVEDVGTLKAILMDLVKRIDPFACRLLNYLPRTVLYEYDAFEKKWKRTDTEGPLLIYSRIDAPSYSLVILDRKQFGKEDFVQPLISGIKFTNKSPYIFVSGRHDSSVFGLWLQDQDDCDRIYHNLTSLLNEVIKNNEEHTPTIEML